MAATVNPALKQLFKVKKGVDFFKNLSDKEISEIVYNIRFRKFAPDETIFNEGAKDNKELYFLIQGSVIVSVRNKKTLMILITKVLT